MALALALKIVIDEIDAQGKAWMRICVERVWYEDQRLGKVSNF